ncbi:MAG: HEAT repeat domain-containing protein [Planctomycetes bacterium]|nr:HEAT repeat domain-containing protein [Planctomycetota bacterium]
MLALATLLPAQEPALPATAPAARLAELEAGEVRARAELRHAEWLNAYGALLAVPDLDADLRDRATRRVAALGLEQRAVLGDLDAAALRTLPTGRLLERLTERTRDAGDELAFAGWLLLGDHTAAAEDALARARTRDPALRDATDRVLADARGELVPRGGYHRYRGAFLPLAERDRARRIDDALAALAGLGVTGAEPPFAPSTDTTDLPRFTALGDRGPAGLRNAAGAIRRALTEDYGEIRGWLATYVRSPSLRAQWLASEAALQQPRQELLDLIGRYDKPEQPQVDARRRALEEQYAAHRTLVDRDWIAFDRVRPDDAHGVLQRVRTREGALAAVDAVLAAETGTGLGVTELQRPTDAATSGARVLPGRELSGLEDVLWLLVQLRAGQLRDTLERGADLLRSDAPNEWERAVCGEVLARAIETFDAERAATSLDPEERSFVAVLNGYRRTLGLMPFEIEERLNVAARKHCEEMVDLGYFGHISPVPRNRTPTDRVRLEGFGGGVGENCLAGNADARGAFEAWYHSPGHHRGMVARSPQLGVGTAAAHSMWTMVMGGADFAWRALHDDLPPDRAAACEAAAEELAAASATAQPSAREEARIAAALERAKALWPDVVAAIARRAFVAARDERAPQHAASPALLRVLVDGDLPIGWRPLQVAAVAAAIDVMRSGRPEAVRSRAFALVAPLCEQTFGYAPGAEADARRDAVLKIRAHWEDVAQWRFRNVAPPGPGVAVPGREAPRRPGHGDGPSADAKRRALTARDRLRLARQHGGGTDTERAVERGLDWLASVQNEDGAWRARSFVMQLGGLDARSAGAGNAEWDLAMTGLALLAFTSAGHTTEQGDHQEVVQRGARWLCAQVIDFGKFETTSSHYMYGHAMATQALCEIYGYTADPYLGAVAQLAVDYIAFAQNPTDGGWRYDARQAGDSSVTGWVVMALNSAWKAGMDVSGFRDALRFIEGVTEPGYYQVGYTGRPGLGTESLRRTSIGIVCRLFLGEAPESPKIQLPCWRIAAQPPAPASADFYYWYYATLGLFQVGGERWERWNAALKPTLLGMQNTERGSPLLGSWPPDGAWGGTGGRIYQTALGVLMLTTYYRYDRAPKVKLSPFTGDLQAAAAPYLDAMATTEDPHERTLLLHRLVDELGPSLVPVVVAKATDAKVDRAVRHLLASALISVATPTQELQLLPLLAAEDGDVAIHAARAIAQIATERSAAALIGALTHPAPQVRSFAAEALGRLGVAEAVPALVARLDAEGNGGTKAAVQAALRRIADRDELTRLVDAALPSGEPGRLAAFEALELIGSGELGKQLAALAEAEPALWRRCVDAVRQHAGQATLPVLVELLDADAPLVRSEAFKLLAAITGQRHGFDPEADARARRDALRAWRDWLARSAGFASDGR